MRQGMLHIRDVEGPKKTGSVETRLEAMEKQVFKCQGMVERGLNANHMMTAEFTNKDMIDANDIGKHLSRLYDRIDQLQGQIYDLQNQNSCHVDPHRRVVAGDQARGAGLAGGDLDGAAQHQNARGLQLQHAREVADLAGPYGEARVAGRGVGDEPERRPKLGLL
ncbi:40S ribosomal protein S5-1 [Hordeum vulgare]|nr:40S ribosomal protein S5-1 [Hordeum vulgare]